MTSYLYVSSLILLTEAQIDELLHRQPMRERTRLDALRTLDAPGGTASRNSAAGSCRKNSAGTCGKR